MRTSDPEASRQAPSFASAGALAGGVFCPHQLPFASSPKRVQMPSKEAKVGPGLENQSLMGPRRGRPVWMSSYPLVPKGQERGEEKGFPPPFSCGPCRGQA
jgi:hypothetical protein